MLAKNQLSGEKLAWTLIGVYIIVLALLLLAKPGRILIFGFPLASLSLGLFFYVKHPVFYLGFTWWLTFLGPFIRRLIDLKKAAHTPQLAAIGISSSPTARSAI